MVAIGMKDGEVYWFAAIRAARNAVFAGETDRKGADVGLTMMGSFALRSRSFGELSYAFVAGCQTLTSSHHTAAPTVHPSSPSSAISGIVCECVCREL